MSPADARHAVDWRRALLLGLLAWRAVSAAATLQGEVIDAANGAPVAGAWITLGDQVVRSDARGHFELASPAPAVAGAERRPGSGRRPRSR